MSRPAGERCACSVQSPDALETTHRVWSKRSYRGYVANVTETCEEGNRLKLIVDVAAEPNGGADGEMLADSIDDLAQRTDVMTIYADGGYNGPDGDERLAKHNVAREQTGIRGNP